VSPCGQRLAYTCDVQGREMYQVVVRDMSAPAAAPIYESGPSYKSEVFWGPDSATLFCVQQVGPTAPQRQQHRLCHHQ
jgi:protease II